MKAIGPFPEKDKRKFGYSRDKRPDCAQVVIGLVVTPEGFPLAYEVMAGNTADKTTLKSFLEKIEQLYGKAERRTSTFMVHDEKSEAKMGDIVAIVETRPLSRRKRWTLARVVRAAVEV